MMVDEYQLRRDIDNLKAQVDKIDLSSFVTSNDTELVFKRVDNDLSTLTGSLEELSSDLDDYHESLENLRIELEGDETTGQTGFITLLDTLEMYMYGKGSQYEDEHGVMRDCDYAHPSSSSLKGMLVDLNTQLGQIVSGDQELSIDLSRLSEYLDGFNGTLQEFEAELQSKGIDMTSLNTGLKQLIYKLSQSIPLVNSHQTRLNDFDDKIGNETDSASTQGSNPTIYGILNDTAELTDETSSAASRLRGLVGDSNSGLIQQTTNLETKIGDRNQGTGILGELDTAQTDISAAQGSLRTILSPNTTRNEIWLCRDIPSMQDFLILETDYGYDISNIEYCVSDGEVQYKRDGSVWVRNSDNLNYTDFIGVVYELPSSYFNVGEPHMEFAYIYEVKTAKYYKFVRSS